MEPTCHLRVELNAISNGYSLDEHSIKGPGTVEERKKRRLKELSKMETIGDGSIAQKVQETDFLRRSTETRKVEAELKKKAAAAEAEAHAKATKASTIKQDDEDMWLAQAGGKGH